MCDCLCKWEGRFCQGITAAPARPRHCRHTIGHQHRSDKPSHHITHGHVAHRAPDTAVASHLHVILSHRDIYRGELRAPWTQEKSYAARIACRVKGSPQCLIYTGETAGCALFYLQTEEYSMVSSSSIGQENFPLLKKPRASHG